jgi:hypothetical protein
MSVLNITILAAWRSNTICKKTSTTLAFYFYLVYNSKAT